MNNRISVPDDAIKNIVNTAFGAEEAYLKSLENVKVIYPENKKDISALFTDARQTSLPESSSDDIFASNIYEDEVFVNNSLRDSEDEPSNRELLANAHMGAAQADEIEQADNDLESDLYNSGVKYSLREGAKEEVEKVLDDLTYREDVLLTDSTPSIIANQKGARNLRMVMKASHVRENILSEEEAIELGLTIDDDTHYHGLGKELFLKVIDELDEVTVAYRGTKNAKDPARRLNYFFLLVSKHKDKDENIINVAVHINKTGQYNRVFFDANKLATVFGREKFYSYVRRHVEEGDLTKIKKRSAAAQQCSKPCRNVRNRICGCF